jgi:hypothetical protein
MARYVFDMVEGRWTWKRVTEKDDKVVSVKECSRTFDFYLECLADAKQNGMHDEPFFRSVTGNLVRLGEKSITKGTELP